MYIFFQNSQQVFFRTPSSVSVAEEAALKELTSNLGVVCNFTRESNVLNEQIFGRAFWKVENVICEVGGADNRSTTMPLAVCF